MVVRSVNHVTNIHRESAVLKFEHKSTNTFWMRDLGKWQAYVFGAVYHFLCYLSFQRKVGCHQIKCTFRVVLMTQFGFHFERVRASDIAALSQSIFSAVFQLLVALVGIELLGVHRGMSQDLLSFRRDSSSRRVYDFICRKFDIKCIKENVENISGFPVTSQ